MTQLEELKARYSRVGAYRTAVTEAQQAISRYVPAACIGASRKQALLGDLMKLFSYLTDEWRGLMETIESMESASLHKEVTDGNVTATYDEDLPY